MPRSLLSRPSADGAALVAPEGPTGNLVAVPVPDAASGAPRTRRPRRPVAAVALLAALGVVALVVASTGPARAQGIDPSTTTVPTPSTSGGTAGSSGTSAAPSAAASIAPSGQVAYATADGRVLVGDGAGTPKEIAHGAAVGRGDQSAVVVSPNGDVVAFIRSDHTLVTVPVDGGAPTVLATDAATTSLGRDPSLAWDALGNSVAYLAAGTADMVPPAQPDRPLSGPGVFAAPKPSGVLGNVVKVVDRAGVVKTRIGNPAERSYVGITWSPSDDVMILESVEPGTTQRFTLVAATGGVASEKPTVFSADDPSFSPDGRFILVVGPAKGLDELIRVDADTLDRATLVTDDGICNPTVSPDATRIVYAAGRNCSRLMLISSKGGKPIDVTPPETPDTATFGVGQLGWTTEGRWITHADCANDAGRITCAGPVLFINPDTGRVEHGPAAATVAPIVRPLIQDVYVDLDLRGPLEFRHSFLIDPTVQGKLTDTQGNGGELEGRLVDGATVLDVHLQSGDGSAFVTGQMTVTDPQGGIDRTFLVLGRAVVLGVRVFSLSGIWVSTDDLPFATGKFDLAVRRR